MNEFFAYTIKVCDTSPYILSFTCLRNYQIINVSPLVHDKKWGHFARIFVSLRVLPEEDFFHHQQVQSMYQNDKLQLNVGINKE